MRLFCPFLMVRPSPTPVCSGFPAGSFTQLRPHFQAGRAVGSDDPAGTRRFDLEFLTLIFVRWPFMIALAATTPRPRSRRGGARLSPCASLSLMRRKVRCALD